MRALVPQQPLRRTQRSATGLKKAREEKTRRRREHARRAMSRRIWPSGDDVAAATAVALGRAVHLEVADWQAANLVRSWCPSASPFASGRSHRRRCPPAAPAAPPSPAPSPSFDCAVAGGRARLARARLVAASSCRRPSRAARQRRLGEARLVQPDGTGLGAAAIRHEVGDRIVSAGTTEARQHASRVALAKQKAVIETAVWAMQVHRLRPALGQRLEVAWYATIQLLRGSSDRRTAASWWWMA